MKGIEKAIGIAHLAHADQKDKGGQPYILHPLHVMEQVKHLGEDYMIVAVLHDVIEDTGWEIDDFIFTGFSPRVVAALCIITRNPEDSYEKYIELVKLNPIARAVKIADLRHNMDITRLNKFSAKENGDLFARYWKAYHYLKN